MKARVWVTTMGKRESPTFGGRDRQRKFFFFFLSEEDLLFLYSQLCTYSLCKFLFGPVIFINCTHSFLLDLGNPNIFLSLTLTMTTLILIFSTYHNENLLSHTLVAYKCHKSITIVVVLFKKLVYYYLKVINYLLYNILIFEK